MLSLKAGRATIGLIQKRARELEDLFDTVIPEKSGVVIPLPSHTAGKNPSLEPVVREIELIIWEILMIIGITGIRDICEGSHWSVGGELAFK